VLHKGAQLSAQPDPMNTGVIYYGYIATMTTSDYAFVLPAPENGTPHAPYLFGDAHQIDFRYVWVIGTENEVLHLGWI
jgi:hypothetical protein